MKSWAYHALNAVMVVLCFYAFYLNSKMTVENHNLIFHNQTLIDNNRGADFKLYQRIESLEKRLDQLERR